MSTMLPVAFYGLEVPANSEPIPAVPNFPATFRVTMAAIDPGVSRFRPISEGPAHRATLKLVREAVSDDDESDEDYDDVDAIRGRLAGAISDEEDEDEEDEDSDEEKNGGPSDPARTKKARKEAAMREIKKLLEEEEEMDLDDAPNGVNGTKANKGKGKATDLDEDSSEDEDLEREVEEFVICTLDSEKIYQQSLDITIGENERVYFQVSGTTDVFLTGNYVLPPDHGHDDEDYDSEEDMDYDLSLDEDELDDEDEEEDALDGLQDPRITEVDTDGEEEAPKLVKADKKKGKNKRPADESDGEGQADTLDDLISKSLKPAEPATNGEQKLSKKQLKKLKKNDGEAVTTAEEAPAKKGKKDQKEPQTGGKADKKVQFAKNLEQGPTGSPKADVKKDAGKKEESSKTGLGVKVINDVTIDDKKLGKGPAAKKGDKIGMRYIGKLTNGKVFDSNKKGKPFSFKLGAGEVIKGWDIGVAGMTVGGERRITIPAKLAYGSKSLPGIPANSDLVFDIKMMSIN